MFAKNYWSHFAPDGASPWDFINGSGYRYEYAGENLAKNFLFSQGVVDAWMNSPTHRENILKKNYTEVGYAIVNGVMNGEETTLVVQMFGTPLSPSIAREEPPVKAPQAPATKPETLTSGNAVLGRDIKQDKINMLPFSLKASYVFMIFFTLALIADFYIAAKLQIVKVGSKHVAHLIFLGFIMLGVVFIIKQGAIL
jgi:hypothetical protein